jgi:exonuclease SbcD
MRSTLVRVCHLSDTHLGYREFHRIDPDTGINQREQDVYDALEQAIDRILRIQPDLVLHAGDLFDNVRPTNRAVNVATEQFGRLSREEIPTVVIAGNHDTPKIVTTGTIMQSLNLLPHIHAVTSDPQAGEGGYQRIDVENMMVHAVSDASTQEQLIRRLDELEPDPDYEWNLLMLHAGVRQVQDQVFSGEFNEHHVGRDVIAREGFDYVALGHYHKRMVVPLGPDSETEARYCGATERFSFNETAYEPGFLRLAFEDGEIRHEVETISTRSFIRIPRIDCEDKSARTIQDELETALPGNDEIDESLLSLHLTNLEPDKHSLLEQNLLEELRDLAFESRIQIYGPDEVDMTDQSLEFADLRKEFADFMEERASVDEDLDRSALIELGQKYLGQALGEEDQR